MKNIVLVGFMGTGKTAIARRLSRRLKMKYTSTDDIIEQKTGKDINDIFAEDGESRFREIEREVVREVSAMDNTVVAAGGGVVIDPDNIKDLKAKGVIICLNATPEDILARTKAFTHRPLLNVPDPLGKIKELLGSREKFYKRADHQVDTSGKSPDKVAAEIITLVKGS